MKTIFSTKKFLKFTPSIAILIFSLLPVFYTWGRLPIWGDTIIPFNSLGLEKYLYQWIPLQNGQYFSINYFPYFLFFKFIEFFTHNVYVISASILFLLKIIAGLGIYKLSKLLYGNEREVLYTVPVVFYLLSPAQLNASYYLYIYSFTPWLVYFVFKMIKLNQVTIQDVMWSSIILFFGSINLPNPKYVFHLFVISSIIFISSIFFRFINIRFFFKNFGKLIIFFLLSAYLILPQLTFVSYYNSEEYDVHIKSGYKDTGKMFDVGDATPLHMFKLHKDSLNLNEDARNQYNSNALINFLSYIIVILIIANVVFVRQRDNNRQKNQYILLLLIAVYLFFAIGPNPPLGFLYQHLVESFPLLAFLRTTAGATFPLSMFYALLLLSVVLNRKTIKEQNLIFSLLIVAFSIIGYPLLNGESYKNVRIASPNTDITARGIKIPQDYFDMQEKLDSVKTDAKTLYTNGGFTYITTTWGYFGPPLYDFLYTTNNVDCITINNPSLYNVGIIFTDKSSLFRVKCPSETNKGSIIKQTDVVELSRFPNDLFLPHFYVSSNSTVSFGNLRNMSNLNFEDDYQIRSAIFFRHQNSGKDDVLNNLNTKKIDNQVLEFRKINPTKYRIKIYSASGQFPLVFSESFHDGWKVYIEKGGLDSRVGGNDTLENYKILDGNADNQASRSELSDYTSKGLISTLGDGKEKVINHKKWDSEKQEEVPDYIEKYSIDFISKNFQGTIQNNNLPEGHFWETWLPTSYKVESSKLSSFFEWNKGVIELPDGNHLMVNGYANSWVIDTDKVCTDNPSFCTKNPDGSYDFEVVVEFWPQRLYYLGCIISITALISCLLWMGVLRVNGRRSDKAILMTKGDDSARMEQ